MGPWGHGWEQTFSRGIHGWCCVWCGWCKVRASHGLGGAVHCSALREQLSN